MWPTVLGLPWSTRAKTAQALLDSDAITLWLSVGSGSGTFLAIVLTVSYCIAVSKLRRPFLSDRYFFVTVRLLRRRVKMTDGDFAVLAQAFNRARARHPLLLTAWVFLPDH